jgi:hypothetical protein
MPLLNGFDVSKSLYEMDKNICIIFDNGGHLFGGKPG